MYVYFKLCIVYFLFALPFQINLQNTNLCIHPIKGHQTKNSKLVLRSCIRNKEQVSIMYYYTLRNTKLIFIILDMV